MGTCGSATRPKFFSAPAQHPTPQPMSPHQEVKSQALKAERAQIRSNMEREQGWLKPLS